MKFIFTSLFLAPGLLFAELSVPHFFSDHMVLQREEDAAIWGKADANAEVSIFFKGNTATTKAAADGHWRTAIKTLSATVAAAPSPVTHSPSMGIGQTDYGSMGTPAVWRGRTSAAAKVDALSSGGMDDYEIPAFLRKQAD